MQEMCKSTAMWASHCLHIPAVVSSPQPQFDFVLNNIKSSNKNHCSKIVFDHIHVMSSVYEHNGIKQSVFK